MAATSVAAAQDQGPTTRTFAVTAHRYALTLDADDIAHSLTIDAYRIAKRASPGQPTTFEFCADRPGTFAYYCNLQAEDGCRRMHGELIVKGRK